MAEVLQREQPDKTIAELWEKALSLHRVRYETEVLPPREQKGFELTRFARDALATSRLGEESSG